jgi:hypothetical protein
VIAARLVARTSTGDSEDESRVEGVQATEEGGVIGQSREHALHQGGQYEEHARQHDRADARSGRQRKNENDRRAACHRESQGAMRVERAVAVGLVADDVEDAEPGEEDLGAIRRSGR